MLARRLEAQLLSGPPARDAVAVTERLLAVQAQDPAGARLAVRARSAGLTAADVDHALTEERSLVVTWLNRGTLHLVRREDYQWLHALTAPRQVTGNARRLAQEGVSPAAADRGVAAIERAVAQDGPLTRRDLAERVRAAGVRTEGQALVHLLVLASLRGLVVRGPMVGREHAYALVSDWIGPATAFDRDRALAELAIRYLAGHGPTDDRDLARWSGLPLRDARAGLRAVAGRLDQLDGGALALRRRVEEPAPQPQPRLLGAFEPLLLGWADRGDVVGRHAAAVISGGIFRPMALVDGRAAGTWRLAGGEVSLEPFGRLARADRVALEQDARDVVRFLGG